MSQYEIEKRQDGSIQVRLSTPFGYIDLVFVDGVEFIKFVAGEHAEAARTLLESL